MAYRKMSGMTLNDVISLIDYVVTEDADGYETTVEELTEVKCDSGNGVTRTEFYEAYKAGLELSAAFEMWACDYGGQKVIEHNGKRYKVERAFPTGDGAVQLNCSEIKR
jgi:hypothetical protein